MTRAAERIAQLARSIEAQLDRAQHPLHVRCLGGVCQVGTSAPGGRWVMWRDVQSLSHELLRRGFGIKLDADEIPF